MASKMLFSLGSLFLLLSVPCSCLYSSSSSVTKLTSNNFDNRVVDNEGVYIVEFYAPWCGHCQRLAPEYEKAAKALKGVVGVGAVDCDEEKSLCSSFSVQGFPTIKIISGKGRKAEDYKGDRSAKAIVDAGLRAADKLVRARSGGGGSSGSEGSGSNKKKGDVVVLDEANFDKLVLKSDDLWLVEFYAPWCGHCKRLEPEWAKAATELKGKVKLGAVDATVESSLAARYGVQGYPTIKFFDSHSKREPEDYDGGRNAEDIVNWALTKHTANIEPPEVVQLKSKSEIEQECESKPLCVIAFLPNILDCQSKCRNDYLATLTKLGDNFKKNGWGWLWSEGGAQSAFEASLDVGGFGYPAMAVLSHKKMKFSLLTGSFGEEGIREFLRDLSYGKGRTSPVRGAAIADIAQIDAWDGKDGVLPEEDDIDLSDVELDDLDKTEL